MWLKGERIPGTDMSALAGKVNSLLAPGWTAYGTSGTILTASPTPPTLGNSTFAANYRRPASGDIVDVTFKLTIGSTFSAGSGGYGFLLPVAASARAIAAACGTFWANDSGTAFRAGVVTIQDSTHANLFRDGSTGSALGSSGPGTAWATGDEVRFSISYEPA